MTRKRHILIDMAALLLAAVLFFIVIPAFAQDATVESPVIEAVVTEAATEPAPPPVIVNVDVPAAPAENGVLTLTVGNVIAIGLSLAAFIGAIVAVVRNGDSSQSVDTRLKMELEARQTDRAWMDNIERGYRALSEQQQQMTDKALSAFEALARLTPFQADDAAAALARDIQKPGPLVTSGTAAAFAQPAAPQQRPPEVDRFTAPAPTPQMPPYGSTADVPPAPTTRVTVNNVFPQDGD